jgi:EAL domain-containing protein (putative c-di-GMP-specific phosphodiesterase class I)
VYQPQVSLPTESYVGAEALLRWKHPVKGFISPVVFIPIAEEMGLIHRLGGWVLTKACCDATRWPTPIKVAVNVSSLQFETGDLVESVRTALMTSGLPAARLELEITESAFVQESERLKGTFDQLLDLGVSFALDDFGTGYSSLGYLHRFPISKIKIDRSFVSGLPKDGHAMAIVRSVIALAYGLQIRTIAEGIETSEQAEALRLIGCDDGQGYLFSKPIDNHSLQRLIQPDNRFELAS